MFKEFRIKYGPLVKLIEKSEKFKKFLESRPVLKPVLDRLKPDTLSPSEFDKEFWDRLNSAEKGSGILILSPYTSKERVEKYLEAIRRAVDRGVDVEIQTLHPEHWSIKHKESHRRNVELLREAHARVELRKNMHEKAVIIRNKESVAYFGSLNVLSKKEMKKEADYMLKFTHPEIVDALYVFVQELAQHSEEVIEEP
ncbi:MAG: phospholipase D-like domain-containing protein [Candidatus Asgardarchaeia archaeon]